jgi:hypothetical protein
MPKPNALINRIWLLSVIAGLLVFLNLAHALQEQRGQTSYMKVDVLNERSDLSDRPAQGVTMDRGKALQEGVRVKLPAGVLTAFFSL